MSDQKGQNRPRSKLRKKYKTIRRCIVYCHENDIVTAYGNLTNNGYKDIEVKHSNGEKYKVIGDKTV